MATFPWQVAFDEDRGERDYVQGERETGCRCQGMREVDNEKERDNNDCT